MEVQNILGISDTSVSGSTSETEPNPYLISFNSVPFRNKHSKDPTLGIGVFSSAKRSSESKIA